MKKIVFIFLVLFVVSNAGAENFGCTCLLCLASPGGPMEYEQCRPTIEKLYKMLWDGEPFPDCAEAKDSGMGVDQGYEPWEPCKPGYEGAMNPSDYGNGSSRVCRKVIGWQWSYDPDGRGGQVKVPVYQEYTPKQNQQPYYIDVNLNGQKQGKRFWYRIKKADEGWLW